MIQLQRDSRLWIAAVVTWFVAAVAQGEQPWRHTGLLPADVSVFIEADGLTASDWEMISPLVAPAVPVEESWRELAGILGLSEDDAFARLLGVRVSLAVQGGWGAGPDWVVLFNTDEATAKLVRRSFKAAPRRVLGGRTVFGLKGGRYRLTQLPGGPAGALGDDRVTLALAPHEGDLFERVCAGGEETLAETERAQECRALGEGAWLTAMIRLSGDHGWLAAVSDTRGPSVDLHVLGVLDDHHTLSPAIDPAAWEGLFEHAVFAVVERAGSLFGRGVMPGSLGPISSLVEAMGPSAGDVTAVVVRRGDAGRVELGAAVSMVGPEDRAARLDTGVSRSLAAVGGEMGLGAWENDFGGLYPAARRRAPLSDAVELQWQYLGRGWQPGWVVMATSDGLADELSATAGAEAGRLGLHITLDGEGGEELPLSAWRSVGVVRPAKGLALLRAGGADPPAMLTRLGALERVSWAVRDLPGGRVDGTLRVTRSDSEPLPGR